MNNEEYLRAAMISAMEKHPDFPEEPEKGIAIIAEEFLELVRAVNDGDPQERIIEEASHVAVTATRFFTKAYKKENER